MQKILSALAIGIYSISGLTAEDRWLGKELKLQMKELACEHSQLDASPSATLKRTADRFDVMLVAYLNCATSGVDPTIGISPPGITLGLSSSKSDIDAGCKCARRFNFSFEFEGVDDYEFETMYFLLDNAVIHHIPFEAAGEATQ